MSHAIDVILHLYVHRHVFEAIYDILRSEIIYHAYKADESYLTLGLLLTLFDLEYDISQTLFK